MSYIDKMSIQNKNGFSNKSRVLLLVVGISALALIGSGFYYLIIRGTQPPVSINGPDNTEKIDLNPPTKAELNETEQFKQNLANNPPVSPNSSPPSTSLKAVTPVIGYLQQSQNGNVESNGYISGAIEEGGTCTLTLEKNGVKVVESRQTMVDAQGMVCGQIVISRTRLNEGAWKAYISYASSAYQGTSEQRNIEIK